MNNIGRWEKRWEGGKEEEEEVADVKGEFYETFGNIHGNINYISVSKNIITRETEKKH